MINEKVTPFHTYENRAIICSVIAIIVGVLVSIFQNDWLWFGRSGSVITVIAIYFASCEFRKKIEKAPFLADKIFDENQEQYIANLKHKIPDKNKEQILKMAKTQTMEEIEQISKKIYDRFLKVETGIFIIGTLIWGFGDLLNALFKR